ncbi:hypothetical protein, partial [Pseudomonas kurunegalensis]
RSGRKKPDVRVYRHFSKSLCGLMGTFQVSNHCYRMTTDINARFVRKALIRGHAALKTASECSFTTRKLRFLGCFRLA